MKMREVIKKVMTMKKLNKRCLLINLVFVSMFVFISLYSEKLAMFYRQENHLSFHILLEFLSIAVSLSIALLIWSVYPRTFVKKRLLIGALFLAVGLLDLLHTMTYNQMPFFFMESSISRATWFWVIARLTEAIFLFFTLNMKDKNSIKMNQKLIFFLSILYVYIAAIVINIGGNSLPTLVIEGQGTTPLKNSMEYIVIVFRLATIVVLIRLHKKSSDDNILYLISAMVCLILSELTFTMYESVNGVLNFLGHVYKIIGFYFLYKGIYLSTIEEPFERQKETEQALRQSEERYRELLNVSPDGILIHVNNMIVYSNQFFANMMKLPGPSSAVGKNIMEFVIEDFRELVQQDIDDTYKNGRMINPSERQYKNAAGKVIDVKVKSVLITYKGESAIMTAIRDISVRKEMEWELEKNERKYKSLFEYNQNFSFALDLNGHFTEVNHVAAVLTGYPKAELIGGNFIPLVSNEKRNETIHFFKMVRSGKSVNFETCIITKCGQKVLLYIDATPIIVKDEIIGIIGVGQDITERKIAEEKLKAANEMFKQISKVDGLTGIPNRRFLDETLQAEWYRGIRNRQPISILMIDIDMFKAYNDTYGHLKGDECLKQVAKTLQGSVGRQTDFVGRYGGEEFCVVLPDTDQQGAIAIAEKIRCNIEALKIPNLNSTVKPFITVSIGLASLIPEMDKEYIELIEQADQALYQAKKSGRNRINVYMNNQLAYTSLTSE